jgi:hypothetical protein
MIFKDASEDVDKSLKQVIKRPQDIILFIVFKITCMLHDAAKVLLFQCVVGNV